MSLWPADIIEWADAETGYLSIPFTWLLPEAQRRVRQRDLFARRWIVGGPAVRLMPDYDLSPAVIGGDLPGVLQRVNRAATRTTVGCMRRCEFCAVRAIEGGFRELPDWPDGYLLCDSNLLAASMAHFERVIERLERRGVADFNQGLDARLLTAEHARAIRRIRKPICRLALDHDSDREAWADAVDRLRTAGIPKRAIRSYVLIGFDGTAEQDLDRCRYVESFGIKALPMWYHRLDALTRNAVTEDQRAMGWSPRKRREVMCWYYYHRTLEARG